MDGISRIEVEDFLFWEAELLDDWRLKDWLALFTDDAHYYVPSTDLPPGASPDTNLFYIADDRFRLGERVERLMKKSAHAEFPRSKTRHLISNVRIRERREDGLEVGAAFATYRSKGETTDVYVGSILYRIVPQDGALRIQEKRCQLDMNGLKPQGRISIIL
ncbi:MAG: aromatic-ring-hydroxylating dioxygenase subunit beta [Sneathiellaceae bacterium]